MTDFSTAQLTHALLPTLSTADMLDVLAGVLNELDRRGGNLSFKGGVETQWADVSHDRDGKYRAVYYTEGSAEDADRSIGRTTQLDEAKALADQLLIKERNNAGSGRSGHLSEADLVPLLQVLDA
jgi:hypothetical protein